MVSASQKIAPIRAVAEFEYKLNLNETLPAQETKDRCRISDAFGNTLKRDYVKVTPLPDAVTVLALIAGWFEEYNDNHSESGLEMSSACELIAAQIAIDWVSGEAGARSD